MIESPVICDSTYVRSADGEVAINGNHSQQADAGHAEKDVKSCIDLKNRKSFFSFWDI